jgi:hypothetical protein
MLRIPPYLDNRLIVGGEVVSLTHRKLSAAQKLFLVLTLVYISDKGCVNSRT